MHDSGRRWWQATSLFSTFLFHLLQLRGIERLWKQIAHLNDFGFALEIGHDHGNVATKFPDQLAAGSARRRERIGIRHHGNSVEPALAFADCFKNGDAFGANREAVSSVLDVAPAKDSAGGGTKRGTHAKIGIRRMRVLPRLPGCRNQSFIFFHPIASAIRGMTAFSKPMNCPFTRSAVSSTSRWLSG